MLTASYVGDRTIRISEAEAVAPGPGQVQIAVAYTGLCGTDLHVLHGKHGCPGARPRSSSGTR